MAKRVVNLQKKKAADEMKLVGEKFKITKKKNIVIYTGEKTYRSPQDKYIVVSPRRDKNTKWSNYNKPMKTEDYRQIKKEVKSYLRGKNKYIFKGYVGNNDVEKLNIQVTSTTPSQMLFLREIYREQENLSAFKPDYNIFSVPDLKLDKEKYKLNSHCAVIVNRTEKTILVVGTGYTNEIKKAIFTALNYYWIKDDRLVMQCSANSNLDGKDVSLFFGFAGTGKTTLCFAEDRLFIADDEVCWDNKGVFNINDGCYGNAFDITKKEDPIFFDLMEKGAVLENIVLNKNKTPDFDNKELTENQRVLYSNDCIESMYPYNYADHPKSIFFLTADSEGLLPLISELNYKQALNYFRLGYSSIIGGMESKSGHPRSAFAVAYSNHLIALKDDYYINLFESKVKEYKPRIYLVNTGWIGGDSFNGQRVDVEVTRALISQAQQETLFNEGYQIDGVFGLKIPINAKGVIKSSLNPSNKWKNKEEYFQKAEALQKKFDIKFQEKNLLKGAI